MQLEAKLLFTSVSRGLFLLPQGGVSGGFWCLAGEKEKKAKPDLSQQQSRMQGRELITGGGVDATFGCFSHSSRGKATNLRRHIHDAKMLQIIA